MGPNVKPFKANRAASAIPNGKWKYATDGKVILEHLSGTKKKKIIGTMNPGQHLKYNIKTGKKDVISGSIEKYIAWKDGKMIFEDSPLYEVAEKLSRMYNVDIKVSED